MLISLGLGQATVSRESLISEFTARLIRSAERTGAPYPYLVLPAYHAQVAQNTTDNLNQVGAQYGYTFTLAEIEAAMTAAGYISSEDYLIGRAREYIAEAVDYALTTEGLTFDQTVDLAQRILLEVDPATAQRTTRDKMTLYVIERGYKQDGAYRPYTPPPLPAAPAELVVPYEPEETDLVIVDRPPEPEDLYEIPPVPYIEPSYAQEPPPEAETTEITIDAKTALWIGGGVALLLALAALGKGGSP